jgi:phosphohistidine swiveling domain-containing protein
MDTVLATGQVVSGTSGGGVLRRAEGPQDVLAIMRREDVAETIVVVDNAAATAIVPLLSAVSGVVCRTGGVTSHLAIVAREFGQLCVVGAKLDVETAPDGVRVEIDPDGSIRSVS